MKKIMKSVYAIVGILTLASCSSSEDFFTENLGNNNKSVKMTFTASQENGSATRTAIGKDGENTKIWWSDRDAIKVFSGSEPQAFTLTEGAGTTNAKFSGEIIESTDYYAIYPNQDGVSFSDKKFSGVQLKATQEAKEGSFDPTAAIMVAKSKGTNLPFKNVISYFKVTPYIDCSEIIVTAHKSKDALAGTFEVNIGEDGTPTIGTITNKEREVKLTGIINKGKDYYILLLPGTFEYGFSVTLKPKNDTSKKYFKQKNSSFTLNRNDLWNVGTMEGAKLVDLSNNTTIPYITFRAGAQQTFSYSDNSLKNNGGNAKLEYSVGSSDWENFNEVDNVTFGGGNGDLRLRAKGKEGNYVAYEDLDPFMGYIDEYSSMFKFGDTNVDVNCEGDIRTLIDYENYYCADTSKDTFKGFFAGMNNLKSAPDMPNMELLDYCYKDMFFGCTGLTSLPEKLLPATTLAKCCYYGMFKSCDGFVHLPENLLPATNLSENCYNEMFRLCDFLETAPALPASILTKGCYNSMFRQCPKLSSVKILATDFSATFCVSYWLAESGVSAASRTLTVVNSSAYEALKSTPLPSNWREGTDGVTIHYTQSE